MVLTSKPAPISSRFLVAQLCMLRLTMVSLDLHRSCWRVVLQLTHVMQTVARRSILLCSPSMCFLFVFSAYLAQPFKPQTPLVTRQLGTLSTTQQFGLSCLTQP